ncbi:metallophosphoesterase family protein [Trichloromonas sp.]|uniref:metallophosphoesterase family protein n=1 Tax=Trichloromonas sp. TaxID=3069249 RepID=UPI003D814913
MMKIGVISDTHIHDLKQGARLAEMLLDNWFADIDMLLHAGDVVNPAFLDLFDGLPVHAVRGNMDSPLGEAPLRRILTVEGFRIGLVHGWGSPATLEQRLLQDFHGLSLDCLVYGHSHVPACRRTQGVLLFNPGSAADRRGEPVHTIGILDVGESIEGRIIAID